MDVVVEPRVLNMETSACSGCHVSAYASNIMPGVEPSDGLADVA